MKQPSKILNLGKREKIQQANSTIMIVVIIAAVIVSMSLVMCNFLWKQKAYNDRVYKEKKIARDTLRDNVKNIKSLQEKFKDIEDPKSPANSQLILDALPGNYDNPATRTSMDFLARRNSLTLEALVSADLEGQVQERSPKPSPVELPMQLTVSGPYDKIRSFIGDLERSIRPMDVRTIVLSSAGDNNMKADLTVVTYFQPTKEATITTKEVQ